MTEQPAEKRVETSPSTRSGRIRTAPVSKAPAWGSDDGLWVQDDSSACERWKMTFNSSNLTLSMSNGVSRSSMAQVTQADCDAIAAKPNARPRKRLGYRTPEECYVQARQESVRGAGVALRS